jgi:uroporphyrinogen-III synthase
VRLLITRPEPQGERTAAALRARGHEVMLAPLLTIEPRAKVDLAAGPWTALIMTSANAVRFLPGHPRRTELLGLPLFVVGQRTAEAARDAGFTKVQSADGDVAALVRLIQGKLGSPGALLYFAGEDRAADLAGLLAGGGHRVETVVVYRARTDRELPAAVAQALREGRIEGVLHFSRRTARAFLAAAAGSGLQLNSLKCNHFCLSPQVAETLTAGGIARTSVAARPEEAAVLDLVEAL